MKSLYLFFILSFLSFGTSCGSDNNLSNDSTIGNSTIGDLKNETPKILILGASRVQGARPRFESFRFELWKLLVAENLNFDFVGTQQDMAQYPNFESEEFDRDHEGHSGWTSGQIKNNLQHWLDQLDTPDIVIFSSPGGNDALQGISFEVILNNINSIIDIIQNKNPNATVIIELPATTKSNINNKAMDRVSQLLEIAISTIAEKQSTNTSDVITLNVGANFKESFFADELHYNEAGAKFVADRYFNLLMKIL